MLTLSLEWFAAPGGVRQAMRMASEAQMEPDEGGWRLRYPEDPPSRRRKAANIVGVLEESGKLDGLSLCEVGAGSGHMTAVFLDAVGGGGSVVSLDVIDTRKEDPGNDFRLITDDKLPIEDASVDVVISNHVIEHVGDRNDQLRHLQEIRRILASGGRCYLSTPNRWSPVENHFKLPFLGWIPRRFGNAYVRLTRRGTVFDVVPLSPRGLDGLCYEAGLIPRNITGAVVDGVIEGSPSSLSSRLLGLAPVHRSAFIARCLPTQARLLRSA